jgi:hypothetical protein
VNVHKYLKIWHPRGKCLDTCLYVGTCNLSKINLQPIQNKWWFAGLCFRVLLITIYVGNKVVHATKAQHYCTRICCIFSKVDCECNDIPKHQLHMCSTKCSNCDNTLNHVVSMYYYRASDMSQWACLTYKYSAYLLECTNPFEVVCKTLGV